MIKENEEGGDGGVEVSSRIAGGKKREREGGRTRWKDRG